MNYYNEFDPFAASWLGELIADGLIAPGIVDRRDIRDVLPSDLKEFTQCHFFAGIGVWSLGLRLAGWSDDRPVWTGSCPCQPFSAAGKGVGFDDERHLWPAWFHLIENAKPRDVPVLIEQVASKDGRAWFDLVSDDMEGLDHAIGALDTCAAGLGAPFIGQRLYGLAAPDDARLERRRAEERNGGRDQRAVGADGVADGLAAPTGGQSWHGNIQSIGQHGQQPQDDSNSSNSGIPLHPVDYWRDAEWLLCRDPNGPVFRPVEPGTFPLAVAGSIRNRLDEVRGAGNSLNIAQAASFIEVAMEYLDA